MTARPWYERGTCRLVVESGDVLPRGCLHQLIVPLRYREGLLLKEANSKVHGSWSSSPQVRTESSDGLVPTVSYQTALMGLG